MFVSVNAKVLGCGDILISLSIRQETKPCQTKNIFLPQECKWIILRLEDFPAREINLPPAVFPPHMIFFNLHGKSASRAAKKPCK